MRSVSILGVAALLVALSNTLAHADGLFYQLPKDGTWVRYKSELKTLSNGEERLFAAGTLTVSSVGTATENDEQCRWIEIASEFTVERKGKKDTIAETTKILVPEKYLTAGQDPSAHVLRAWRKRGKQAAAAIDLAGDGARDIKSMNEILRGPAEDGKPLEAAVIESKLGKLECEGFRGVERDTSYEVRLHEKASFGVVTYRHETNRGSLGRAIEFTLADQGTDAKSLIPEAK